MPTVTQRSSKSADAHILEDHGHTTLRRHASCPPGTLRQAHLASDPTRRMPASATRSLLITRDDQARAPSATTEYSASTSSPINPADSSWAHVSMTTQAQLELGSKAKDVRIALDSGSFKAVYSPGLGSCFQMEIEQDSPLNAWTDPLVWGCHDDENYTYDNGCYSELSSAMLRHTCVLFVGAHTPSSLSCPGCDDLTEITSGSLRYSGGAPN
ncbi:hypothetical protein C0992_008979 [Termitomyces sp. T32_za158]|nr:hypothetical protein C0992_008979 [Termitomyces sp. T32_za158]